MDDDLYDEFGNYIGPNLDSSEEDSEKGNELEEEENEDNQLEEETNSIPNQKNAIILHEDKQYYPDADEIYPGVEIEVNPEDEQDITVPIINPIKLKVFSVLEKKVPETIYTTDFLTSLMDKPNLMRNVVVLGAIHHGKTTFLDMLIESTHSEQWSDDIDTHYTDSRKDEEERGISIGSTPVSIILPSGRGKSYLLNLIDTPGHLDFSGEVTASIRICDCAVLIVDAVEGVNMTTNRFLNEALREGLSVILVINKMDRLILELKLPPSDAYHKLHQIIEEVNITISQFGDKSHPKLNPVLGNVLFASAQHRWCFSLRSYAEHYCETFSGIAVDSFVKFLWGNYYFDETTRKFTTQTITDKGARSFVQFCLEPIYKIYTQAVGEDPSSLGRALKSVGIKFKKSELHKNVKPLLRMVMRKFFVGYSCLVDSLLKHTKSPVENADEKIQRIYSGNQTTEVAQSLRTCNPEGPLMIHITKLYPTSDGKDFLAFGRIMSGTIKVNDVVNVLGEDFTLEDSEDMIRKEVTCLSVAEARYKIDVDHMTAGNWVLLEGVSEIIYSTATICDLKLQNAEIFSTLSFTTSSTIKVSIEALRPSEVPKMENGLRCVCKCYPLIKQKVEESGEHVLYGTGELQLDCVLHDIRSLFCDMEVKVADPVVSFSETVIDISTMKCWAKTPNGANRITMIAEPLEENLDKDIENKKISLDMPPKQISDFLTQNYNWDILAARSIWAFGPTNHSPNVLINDTLPSEVDTQLLSSVKDHIIQGFRWACKEGPLCDEPIRNVKFKITDVTISNDAIQRGAGQIIPTSRRVVYSSVLLAQPRLMEPVDYIEIICPADMVKPVQDVLGVRRGLVAAERPKPGTPFFVLYAYIPVIESFGFEVDLRVHTQGLAFCQHTFDHWQLVEGDPLDSSIILHQMEPAPVQHLCREFMIKTRRRKGLAEDVSVVKFFDPDMLIELKQQEESLSDL